MDGPVFMIGFLLAVGRGVGDVAELRVFSKWFNYMGLSSFSSLFWVRFVFLRLADKT